MVAWHGAWMPHGMVHGCHMAWCMDATWHGACVTYDTWQEEVDFKHTCGTSGMNACHVSNMWHELPYV